MEEKYNFFKHQEEYNKENNELFNNFLNDYFFETFREKGSKIQLEFIFSPDCNLACKYCYVHKFYNKTFPSETFDSKKSIQNALKMCQWLVDNGYTPGIDIFSGELFAQECGFELLENLINFYKTVPLEKRIPYINIPTNFTFLNSEELTTRMKKDLYELKELDIYVNLSASVDGKYMEENRPYGKKLDLLDNNYRDDNYYDKVFKFAKEFDFGFHPMIYSKNIKNWKKNFEWFQEQFEKYDLPWTNIYLLQVRNKEWDEESNIEFYNFIRYLINWSWEKINDKDEFINFLFKNKTYRTNGFNILRGPLVSYDQGYTCGIQRELSIRLNDMKVFPCHRLMYPGFEIGQFEYLKDEKKFIFNTKNASLGLNIFAGNFRSMPECVKCPMNELCLGGCLGAQYETTKNITAPIPTVCQNSFYYLKALADGFDELGLFPDIENYVTEKVLYQLQLLRRISFNDK